MESVEDHLIYQENSGPEFQQETLRFLADIRRWARFLSILGFVGIAFLILLGTAMGSIDTAEYGLPIPSGVLGMLYTIMAAIGFFPTLFLYRFSERMKKALANNDTEELKLAFMNLKMHYKFIGIASIFMIVLYLLAMIFGLGTAMIGAV